MRASTVPEFFCGACGCPAVALPSRVDDDAPVTCQGCGSGLGTWRDYKQQVKRKIWASRPAGSSLRGLCADP